MLDIIKQYANLSTRLFIAQSKKYYGELEFYMSYKNENEVPFDWLYLDFETFKTEAANANLKIEKIIDGENFDYLVRLCDE